jgi:hypothetical protein
MNTLTVKIYYGYKSESNEFFLPYNGYELDTTNNLSFVPDPGIPDLYQIQIPVQQLKSEMINDQPALKALNDYPIYFNPKRKPETTITVNVPNLDSDNLLSYISENNIVKITARTFTRNIFTSKYTHSTDTIENYTSFEFLTPTGSTVSLEDAIKSGIIYNNYILDNQVTNKLNSLNQLGFKSPINLYKNTATGLKQYNIDAKWGVKYSINIDGKAIYKTAKVHIDGNNKSFNYSSNGSDVNYEYIANRSANVSNPYVVQYEKVNVFIPGNESYYTGADTNYSDPDGGVKIITSTKHYLVDGAIIHIYHPSLPTPKSILGRTIFNSDQLKNYSNRGSKFYYVKVINDTSFSLYEDKQLTKPASSIRQFNNTIKPISEIAYLLIRGGDAETSYQRVLSNAYNDNKEYFTITNLVGENYLDDLILQSMQKNLYYADLQSIVSSFINYGPLCELKNKKSTKNTTWQYMFPDLISKLIENSIPEFISHKKPFDEPLLAELETIIRDKNCLDTLYYITHTIPNITIEIDDIVLDSITLGDNATNVTLFFDTQTENTNETSFWRVKNA